MILASPERIEAVRAAAEAVTPDVLESDRPDFGGAFSDGGGDREVAPRRTALRYCRSCDGA